MSERIPDHPIISEMEINGFIDRYLDCEVCGETILMSESLTDEREIYTFCSEDCKSIYVSDLSYPKVKEI